MGYYKRISKAFENAASLPLDINTQYVLMSDCHRGNGTSNDNFIKNQNLFFAALEFYYERNYSYIELGDGDELWENRSFSQIIEIHSNAFWLMSKFYYEKRLYMLYGNHDICKQQEQFLEKNCSSYYCDNSRCHIPLLPGLNVYQSIILRDSLKYHDIYLTHGHQADFLNCNHWKLARFLVRYIWQPLEHIGFLDPTSAAKNTTKKKKVEKKLSHWAKSENKLLITGHTHRPRLSKINEAPFQNTGSCIHPRCITAIEIDKRSLTLVKWTYDTRIDRSLYVNRHVLAGPISIDEFYERL